MFLQYYISFYRFFIIGMPHNCLGHLDFCSSKVSAWRFGFSQLWLLFISAITPSVGLFLIYPSLTASVNTGCKLHGVWKISEDSLRDFISKYIFAKYAKNSSKAITSELFSASIANYAFLIIGVKTGLNIISLH